MSRQSSARWPAQVLRELSAFTDSGIALLDAIPKVVRNHRRIGVHLRDLLGSLRNGFPAGDALYAVGAISRESAFRLNVAEHSGKLPQALRELADRQERTDRRQRKLRSRLLFSRMVVGIALLCGLALGITNDRPLGQLLGTLAFGLIAFSIFIALLIRTVSIEQTSWLAWAWRLRLISRSQRIARLFDHYLISILQVQMEAGLAPSQALEQAVGAIDAPGFADAINGAAASVRNGSGLSDALGCEQLVYSSELQQVLLAGEQSGRLTQGLAHFLELQQVHIELWIDGVADWLPRIGYLAGLLFALDMLRAAGAV